MMLRILFLYAFFAALLFGAKDPNKTVAIVNGYKITQKELDRQIDTLVPRNFIHANVTQEKRDSLAPEALEALIERRVLIDYAKKRGYKISDKELNKRVKQYIKAFGSKKNLTMRLKQSGLSFEEFEKALRGDMLLEKLYEKEVKTDFSEKDLKEYYEKNRFKFKLPPKLKLKVIYIRNDPTDPKGGEKAKKRAMEVMEKLKKGEKFEDLARKYSNDLSRIKGGDLGFVHKGMLDAKVEDAAFKLKKGEISDLIETTKGFFIIKLEEISPEKQLKFEEVKEKLKRELKTNRENKKKKEILKRAKEESKIEILI